MAYGNYFPATYQPMYYQQQNPYYQQNQPVMQQNQQNQQMQQAQQPQQTIQQSGFICVRSLEEVYPWPIAPGNSITFYVECNPPLIATKTKGFSQLENPVVKVFDLAERKEGSKNAPESSTSEDKENESKDTAFALKSDIEAIRGELDAINEKLKAQSEKKPVKKAKLMEGEDDE